MNITSLYESLLFDASRKPLWLSQIVLPWAVWAEGLPSTTQLHFTGKNPSHCPVPYSQPLTFQEEISTLLRKHLFCNYKKTKALSESFAGSPGLPLYNHGHMTILWASVPCQFCFHKMISEPELRAAAAEEITLTRCTYTIFLLQGSLTMDLDFTQGSLFLKTSIHLGNKSLYVTHVSLQWGQMRARSPLFSTSLSGGITTWKSTINKPCCCEHLGCEPWMEDSLCVSLFFWCSAFQIKKFLKRKRKGD